MNLALPGRLALIKDNLTWGYLAALARVVLSLRDSSMAA
jgi:hypothetical protein